MNRTRPIRFSFRLQQATWLFSLSAGALGLFAALLPAPAAAQSINEVMREVKFEQRLNQPLPLDLPFRDEAGRTVKLGDYFGKRPVIVALVYYECPMLCTYVLNGMVKGLKPVSLDAGRDFDVVAISFNPSETPALAAEKKAAYTHDYRRPGTEAGWHFLTGDADSIRGVTEAAGFHYMYDPETRQFAHASGLIVATPDGRMHRYFYGIEYAPRDLRFALVEASAGKLGTPVDQVLLYCFHYDPKTGKYGVVITAVLRIAGTATVLVLVTFLLVMFRRDRRAAQAGMVLPRHQETGV